MQVIFEQNTIIGASIMAMGQAVGTSGGGYDHHIAVLDNTYQGVFGNDRWGIIPVFDSDSALTPHRCSH